MIVLWAPEAAQDRDDIMDYIAADNLSAALRMDQLFGEAAAPDMIQNQKEKRGGALLVLMFYSSRAESFS